MTPKEAIRNICDDAGLKGKYRSISVETRWLAVIQQCVDDATADMRTVADYNECCRAKKEWQKAATSLTNKAGNLVFENTKLQAMLEKHQFACLDDFDHRYCPECEKRKEEGHAADCGIAKLLGAES